MAPSYKDYVVLVQIELPFPAMHLAVNGVYVSTVPLDAQIVCTVCSAKIILKEPGFTQYIKLICDQKLQWGIIILLYIYVLLYTSQSLDPLRKQLDLHKQLSEVARGQEF